MMDDLINRQALLRDIEKYHLSDGKFQHWIEVQPSVEAEPVVRCKDCKWFNTTGCAIKIMDESDKPHEDDFCSFAERKTEDAVEVVRCKDCAYHDEVDEHELWCMGNGYPARLVTPDEYCSKGAPK